MKPKNHNNYDNLRISQWNKGGAPYQNRKDDILTIINDHKPHILGIGEACLNKTSYLPAITIEGYKVEYDQLLEMNLKSQVVVYIKDSVKYVRRKNLEPVGMACLWLEICRYNEPNFLVCVTYREWTDQTMTQQDGRYMPNQIDRLNKICK